MSGSTSSDINANPYSLGFLSTRDNNTTEEATVKMYENPLNKFFPFRADRFSKDAWRVRRQNKSCTSCLHCKKKWQKNLSGTSCTLNHYTDVHESNRRCCCLVASECMEAGSLMGMSPNNCKPVLGHMQLTKAQIRLPSQSQIRVIIVCFRYSQALDHPKSKLPLENHTQWLS